MNLYYLTIRGAGIGKEDAPGWTLESAEVGEMTRLPGMGGAAKSLRSN